jgi:hypothetical protein
VFGCETIEVTVTVMAEAGGAGLGCPRSEVTVTVITEAGDPWP